MWFGWGKIEVAGKATRRIRNRRDGEIGLSDAAAVLSKMVVLLMQSRL